MLGYSYKILRFIKYLFFICCSPQIVVSEDISILSTADLLEKIGAEIEIDAGDPANVIGTCEKNPKLCDEKKIIKNDSISVIRNVQTELNRLGCNAGPVDGVIGRRTITAFEAFIVSTNENYDRSDILSDRFLATLKNMENACQPRSRNTASIPNQVQSKILPAMLASHWELICKGNQGVKESFARVSRYNNQNGKVSFVITSYNGLTNSYHGKLDGEKFTLFDMAGEFSDGYSKFKLDTPECPKGLFGYSMAE